MSSSAGYYGYVSGIVTAAALQPLDNIKMALIIPPSKLQLSSNFAKNLYLVTKYIHFEEGFKSFYRGLIANVWKTGLGSAIYFYSLRLLEKFQSDTTAVGNFVNSAFSRVVSTASTNPLAIAETRYQIHCENARWQGNILKNMGVMYKTEGLRAYFKGCNATCLKQAGFAGFYYSFYSHGKQMGFTSVVAGMAAGMVSTLITHPFQVIRTSAQADRNTNSLSIAQHLVKLANEGKVFTGVAPRLVKKPAANTICFVLFQYFEKLQHEKN